MLESMYPISFSAILRQLEICGANHILISDLAIALKVVIFYKGSVYRPKYHVSVYNLYDDVITLHDSDDLKS